MLFDFSTVKRQEKRNSLDREHENIFFMFTIIFSIKTAGECETPLLLKKKKGRSEKSDVSNVLFPDIGKIANLLPGLFI